GTNGARPVHPGHRHEGVLRRPALTLAKGHEREHQRAAKAVLPQRHRSIEVVSGGSGSRGLHAEQPSPKSPQLENPCRGIQRAATLTPTRRCCNDRLNSDNTPAWPSARSCSITAWPAASVGSAPPTTTR